MNRNGVECFIYSISYLYLYTYVIYNYRDYILSNTNRQIKS